MRMRYLDWEFWAGNPFIPWDRIWAAVVLAVYLYQIHWVYRDAQRRFTTGIWFALLAAVLPFGGWLFYLLYRQSSLVDYDMIDLRERIFERYPAVEYDLYLAYKRQEALDNTLVRAKAFFFAEGVGALEAATDAYPEHIMRSREKELAAAREKKVRETYERARIRVGERAASTAVTVGRAFSPRRTRLEEKLSLMDTLTEAPLPDRELEDLIYLGKLRVARMYCEDQLQIAKEMNDERRILSYQKHLKRVEELLGREREPGGRLG
jgi:hypothetical protein